MFDPPGKQAGHDSRVASPPYIESLRVHIEDAFEASGTIIGPHMGHAHALWKHTTFNTLNKKYSYHLPACPMCWFQLVCVITYISTVSILCKAMGRRNTPRMSKTVTHALKSCEDLKMVPSKRLLALWNLICIRWVNMNLSPRREHIRPGNQWVLALITFSIDSIDKLQVDSLPSE